MPRKYPLTAVVDRTVTDTIDLTVEADDEATAYDIARKVLDKFPEAHGESGVKFCYVTHREYGRPELLDLKDTEDEGVA